MLIVMLVFFLLLAMTWTLDLQLLNPSLKPIELTTTSPPPHMKNTNINYIS